jgi:DNA (cytosine-5)-methyltransferase 1
MARLQTFPDTHVFAGSDRSARRQIGNAVPVAIGELLGLEIRRQLLDDDSGRALTQIPEPRDDCPAPTRPTKVPEQYLHLCGEHEDHPGAGLGPRARANAAKLVGVAA